MEKDITKLCYIEERNADIRFLSEFPLMELHPYYSSRGFRAIGQVFVCCSRGVGCSGLVAHNDQLAWHPLHRNSIYSSLSFSTYEPCICICIYQMPLQINQVHLHAQKGERC